ncbi:MAG: hypothetical protein CL846_06240 [Crocinitomicaceae bacterium]|nr:hypothetical protein [Crocinitomicaceae bacterium]
MNYKKLNNLAGWLVFAIATAVYLLTVEQTTSLWDCGEYIITANKLEVGHPPGAPLFMMLGRLFSAFASPENAAMMVNSMSALSSSITILFLFWTITMLGRKLVLKSGEINKENSLAIIGAGIVGALAYTFTDSFWFSAVEGEVYAMSSMFTAIVFWAILKWDVEDDEHKKAIENNVEYKGHPTRWIIFISYMIGLSIGVHLLNLLAIPAIVFVVYFKKYPFAWKSFFGAGLLSLVILGGVQGFIIPNTISFADAFERLFTNSYGLPFNTGAAFFFLLLITLIILGLRYATKKGKTLWYDVIMSLAVLLIGYYSFMMIIVRSNANPPLDENNPETMSQYYSYLKRDQYGDWPLLSGPYFNSLRYSQVAPQSRPDDFSECNEKYLEPKKDNYFKVLSITLKTNLIIPKNQIGKIQKAIKSLNLDFKKNEIEELYLDQKEVTFISDRDLNIFLEKVNSVNEEAKKLGITSSLSFSEPKQKYININENQGRQYKFHPDGITLFPRMWRNDHNTPQGYMYWSGYEKDELTNIYFKDGNQDDLLPVMKQKLQYYKQLKDEAIKAISKGDRETYKKYITEAVRVGEDGFFKPSFKENLTYLFNYQLGWMYGRYFMWNFAGRQNDVQGFGGTPKMGGNSLMEGNWISGINFIDNQRLGNQDILPLKISENKGHNKYYYLPLILGLIGMFFQIWKHPKGWFTVFLLFLLTGIAIVFYLNQKPWEPRERDYAYAASFYAFAIWIGLGVYALYYAAKEISFNQIKPVALYALGGSALITVVQSAGDSQAFGLSLLFISVVSVLLFALMILIRKYLKNGTIYVGLAFSLGMVVPAILAVQNWDDHDRSNRSTARDSAHNYLMSCDYNAILFTNGDNDTFPLWYIQEVEGVRTDIRVANMSLLGTDWHINQMKKKAYESDPLPIKMPERLYRQGTRDVVYFDENPNKATKSFSASEAIDAISDEKNTDIRGCGSKITEIDFKNLYINVNKQNSVKSGLVSLKQAGLDYEINDVITVKDKASFELLVNDSSCNPCDSLISIGTTYLVESENSLYQVVKDSLFKSEYKPSSWKSNKCFIKDDLEKSISWRISGGYATKADLAVIDILSNYNWDRPICFASTAGMGANKKLAKYTQTEGLVHKLVPIISDPNGGGFNVEKTYKLLTSGYGLNKPEGVDSVSFLWGNMNESGVLVDDYSLNHVVALRYSAYRTSAYLLQQGEREKAIAVLDNVFEKMPIENNQVPIKSAAVNALCSIYYKAGEKEKGDKIAKTLSKYLISEINFFLNQNEHFLINYAYQWGEALKQLDDLEQMSNPNYEKLMNKYNNKMNSLQSELGLEYKINQYNSMIQFVQSNKDSLMSSPQAQQINYAVSQLSEEIDSLKKVYNQQKISVETEFRDSIIKLSSVLVEPSQFQAIIDKSKEVYLNEGEASKFVNKKGILKNLPDRYKYYWGSL